ncbi:MAG: hypothetical protein ABII12_04240 [Planctomycetota bacterium]
MILRLACCVSLVLILAPAASAMPDEVPPPAMYKASGTDAQAPTAQVLLADRISFVEELYELTAEQEGKILPLLQQLVPAQEQYDVGCCLTLHRMQIAVSLIGHDSDKSPEERARAIARFEDQINAIHADAPLSLYGVMQKVEPLLPAQQVKAAHARIEAIITTRAKHKGQVGRAYPSQIDYLLAPALSAGEPPVLPEIAKPVATHKQATLADAAVFTTEQALPVREITATPPNPQKLHAAQPKRPNRPPTPVEPPKPLESAPPESDWRAFSEETAKKYGFNDSQKEVANHVVENYLVRAGLHREKASAEYKAAAGLADAAEKQKSLAELNKPLDKLYYELTRRVDSLVTLEQKIAVDGDDSVPMASPATHRAKPRAPKARNKPAQAREPAGSTAPAAKAKPAEQGKTAPKTKDPGAS